MMRVERLDVDTGETRQRFGPRPSMPSISESSCRLYAPAGAIAFVVNTPGVSVQEWDDASRPRSRSCALQARSRPADTRTAPRTGPTARRQRPATGARVSCGHFARSQPERAYDLGRPKPGRPYDLPGRPYVLSRRPEGLRLLLSRWPARRACDYCRPVGPSYSSSAPTTVPPLTPPRASQTPD